MNVLVALTLFNEVLAELKIRIGGKNYAYSLLMSKIEQLCPKRLYFATTLATLLG